MGTTASQESSAAVSGDQRAETASHTPGPWFITVYDKHTDVDSKHWTVAGGVGNADADLIAAAPDLLTALKALADAADAEHITWADLGAARAAIAKATGARVTAPTPATSSAKD